MKHGGANHPWSFGQQLRRRVMQPLLNAFIGHESQIAPDIRARPRSTAFRLTHTPGPAESADRADAAPAGPRWTRLRSPSLCACPRLDDPTTRVKAVYTRRASH